eukprot:m.17205 g.17205  ORF g.17205 m.17205 type:complete len:130 (+) comp11051_c0_seq1:60-449(+)
MILKVTSVHSIADVSAKLEKVVPAHKFGIVSVFDLQKKMNSKGVEFDKECIIFEVCNPRKAKDVLEKNMAVSTALPCRISLYPNQDGQTELATILPSAMLMKLFDDPALQPMASEVDEVLTKIMKEAAK